MLQGVAKTNKLKRKKKKEQIRNRGNKWDPSVFQLLLLQNTAVLMADGYSHQLKASPAARW